MAVFTAIDDAEAYFQAKTYTGDGGTPSITFDGDTDMQPDLVWYKSRSNAYSHGLFDVLRGASEQLYAEDTAAEATYSGVSSFDSDGFTLGTDAGGNENSATYVAWCWKANGAGSSNTDGSITSTVSANTTAGFSIVKWTGDDSTATIGHGLGAVPKMIITKRYDASGNWFTYHHSLGNTKYILLEATDAEATSSNAWNDTSPTSSVFTKASATNIDTGTYIAYCFAEKQGHSKIGSFIGNGDADGPFVYTGFRPAFLIVKRSSASGNNWLILDNKRDPINQMVLGLFPDTTNIEASGYYWDFTSNGFKVRTGGPGENASDSTFIYMAFAESPLVNSNGVPTNAR